MQILSFTDYEELSLWAFEHTLAALIRKPDLVLCPASGNSPLLTYQFLADYARSNPTVFRGLRIVQLDEFIVPGLNRGVGDAYMEKHILQPLRIPPERYLGFRSGTDPAEEARRFREQLDGWGPIDLCLLGMGLNGHLGLNEPATELALHTHVATLEPSSQAHHMVSDQPVKPHTGITMGMADILHAREVLLLVNGEHKRAAMRELAKPRIATHFPASLLWLHPRAWCGADRAALPE